MGVFYIVWPLDDQMREHLESEGIDAPDAGSRWPTRAELRQVIDSLAGFDIEYIENAPGERWSASLTEPIDGGWWTLIHAEPQNGDDSLTEVTFEKGDPALVIAVVQALSHTTGPLTIVADAGEPPLMVSTARSLSELVEEWAFGADDSVRFGRLLSSVPGVVD